MTLWKACLLSSLAYISIGAELAWQPTAGGRVAKLTIPPSAKIGFTSIRESGVTFTNLLTKERYTTNQVYLNGSGVAAGDVDGDGLADLFFAGMMGPNALFKNLGDWRFTNITAQAGVARPELDCTGTALTDLDGDEDLDLIVNTIGQGTHLLLNDGKGEFKAAGVFNLTGGGSSVTIADTDGDGDLDIYVANYRINTVRDDPQAKIAGEYVNGKPVPSKYNGRSLSEPDLVGRFVFGPTGKIIENGQLDVFLRNDGGGKFQPVPLAELLFEPDGKPLQALPYDWGLSCMFHDFTGDGAPDLYVANDFDSPDRFWINDGTGKFRAAGWEALRHISMFSMGVDCGDINRDGHTDFFVADMLSRSHSLRQVQTGEVPPYVHHPGEFRDRPSYSQNTLYLNRGNGTFAEIGEYAGVEASEWSWTPAFLDVDLDGYEDLLVSNGHELEMMNGDAIEQAEVIKKQRQLSRMELLNLRHLFKRFQTANAAFRNRGDLTFEDVSAAWGFTEAMVSHGMALADLDNDGDLDLAINNLNDPASIYRNEGSSPRLGVRLKGLGENRQGIGARIKVSGATVEQTAEMIAGGRYVSSDQAQRTFAAGRADSLRVEVRWRSGKISVMDKIPPNSLVEVAEESATHSAEQQRQTPAPLFTAVPLNHTHVDEPFDEFQRQPLLPMRLGQLGPGVAWHDYNGDGTEELFIGAGRGGRLAMFQYEGGKFTNTAQEMFQRPLGRDQTSLIGLGVSLMAGASNYQDGLTNGGWVRVYDLHRKAAGEAIIGVDSAAGPMAVADINGNGKLDLFLGGRALAGKYPAPANSHLLGQEGARFQPMTRLERFGLVSGALFTDLDNDNDPDLVTACHWGPIRVLRNDQGKFVEITEEVGLSEMPGLWNGVSAGDFNNDGQMDLIASNWGLNTRWTASKERPLKIYYGDFDSNGVQDLVEAQYEPEMKQEVPIKGHRLLTMGLPYLREKYPTREKFGAAGVEEMIGPALAKAQVVKATELRTMLFIRQGTGFVARPLPEAVQFSPAFGLAVADYNLDGNEDVFVAQNFFGTPLDTPRSDAGTGLVLLGDGKGGFQVLDPEQSGVTMSGEGRAVAVSDYDHDGRPDVAATQNSGLTQVYKNQIGLRGVRVILQGPPTNPAGIGSKIRAPKGPLREIRSGEGYWSLNSMVQIFPPGTRELETVWHDGKQTRTTIPEKTREVLVVYPAP